MPFIQVLIPNDDILCTATFISVKQRCWFRLIRISHLTGMSLFYDISASGDGYTIFLFNVCLKSNQNIAFLQVEIL